MGRNFEGKFDAGGKKIAVVASRFNDFFTRALRPDARPLAEGMVVSPADRRISQIEKIRGEALVQATPFGRSVHGCHLPKRHRT